MMRRFYSVLLPTALATLVVLTGVARAKPSIAVLGLEVADEGGNVDEASTQVATKLTAALRARARQPSQPYTLAPNSDKDLLELKLLSDCSDENPKCMSAMAKELKADRLLYGRITKRKDGYQVSLDLLNAKTKAMERSTSELIPFAQANDDGLRGWGRSLYNRLTGVPEEGSLVIHSNTDKGTVYVDGEVKTTLSAGSATITGLSEGSHTVGVEAQGYGSYGGEVAIKAGGSTDLNVTLEKKGGGGMLVGGNGGGGRPGGVSRALFWTSLVLTGAGAAAVTVTGLQVRGSLKDDQLAAVEALGNRATMPIKLNKSNACADAQMHDSSDPGVKAVLDACDAGKSRAMLTNVFLGASFVTAVAASYFYYKGYIAPGASEKKERSAVRIIPQVGPTQVGAGVAIEF